MKTLVIIPTYNEADSIVDIITSLIEQNICADVLVVDDNSPDSTAMRVQSLNSPRIHLLLRESKSGLGSAYRAGFQWALDSGLNFTHIVSMDGDGSHRSVDLARMLNSPGDLVLGTRWMEGGSTVNWPIYRQLLSRAGTKYAQLALRLPFDDLTGGFRVYSLEMLRQLNFNAITSEGYVFQVEMVRAISTLTTSIVQVPITFIERETGVSKMNRSIVIEAIVVITRWALRGRAGYNADKLHYVK